MLRRAASLGLTAVLVLFLAGCFVIATNLPAGMGRGGDERLLGAWQGVDSEDGKPAGAFLHFQKLEDPAKPLRLVWVEKNEHQVYEFTTATIGGRNVFAARLTNSTDDDIPPGWFLGFYKFEGERAVEFRLLDAEKVGELIGRGKVRGKRPPGKYEMSTLTGSPDELARFMASPEALEAAAKEPARLERLSGAN